ncbi:MAG: ATP-grasp domain-containing protein [Streptosporangiales bacterium]|nr:ATP-grasp domain-containing protein [Streptosporangiales bacterium]
MFDTVLVANRGEIAVRIMRTLRRLGVRAVAVHAPDEATARHVREADVTVEVPGYLAIDAIVRAAVATGAQAVHPGYGFLAENPAFARACAAAGVVFAGPPPEAIEAMGDKIAAKRTVAAAGVPVLPGFEESDGPLGPEACAEAARAAGYPLMIKPSAGGGGKGMAVVRDPAELAGAVEAARRTAAAAFGDDRLLAERYVESPRHIEIQVIADAHGAVVHLGERECSLQRRHQKIVEEAPSPLLDAATRARMGEAAVAAARTVGYTGAGTVEYVVAGDDPEAFAFLEMNTRLQVEHPVTELVATAGGRSLDLVELQLRVAAGEPLPFRQEDVALSGHAIEARVYAEDPARGFLPTGGRVLRLAEPRGPGVRVDSGLAEGDAVGTGYDPMLAKIIAHGPDRAAALHRLDQALATTTLLGVTTNLAYLRGLLASPEVQAGRIDTGLAERVRVASGPGADDTLGASSGTTPATGPSAAAVLPDAVLAAAALERRLALEPHGPVIDPWEIPSGWRPGGPAWSTLRVRAGGETVGVALRGRAHDAYVRIGDGPELAASARVDGADLVITLDGVTHRFAFAADGDVLWLGRDGRTWALTEEEPLAAARHEHAAGPGDGVVRSPMPGTVLAVKAAAGEAVTKGQPLLIVEAMKMEHTVAAPVDGVLTELHATPGRAVALDEVLAVVTPPADPSSDEAGRATS